MWSAKNPCLRQSILASGKVSLPAAKYPCQRQSSTCQRQSSTCQRQSSTCQRQCSTCQRQCSTCQRQCSTCQRQCSTCHTVIPYSAVWRLIWNFRTNDRFVSGIFQQKQVDILSSYQTQLSLSKYIRDQRSTFNSMSIKKYIEASTGINMSRSSISKFMKQRLKMSFKRVSSRPMFKDPWLMKFMKLVFWIEYSNILNDDTILINIDEVLFSNNTKTNYSLEVRGAPNYVSNISFKGSLSVIGTITCQGDWFFSNLVKNNWSEVFIDYLKNWIEKDFAVNSSKIILILNNLPIHSSN